LAATLTLTACSGATNDGNGSDTQAGAGAGDTSGTAANSADVMFTTMMIPHHAQAIEMSDILLAKSGIHPKVRDLAERIKAAQAPEVTQMKGWLNDWGKGADMHGMDHSEHAGMGGMMGQDDIAQLKKATGQDATRTFLTGMVAHHCGAIDMAKMVLAQGRDPQVEHLAEHIVSDQQAELNEMNRLLNQ
jgi:uncharacterized protein (DUF305 family)